MAISLNCPRAASRFLAISGQDLGNVIGFFEAFVPEPTDVEAALVAVDEFVVFVSLYWSVKAWRLSGKRPRVKNLICGQFLEEGLWHRSYRDRFTESIEDFN